MKIYIAHYQTPIGKVEIEGTQEEIVALDFVDHPRSGDNNLPEVLKECVKQIDEYFNGQRNVFSVNLSLQGTEFQNAVWRRLLNIPYGQTRSYGELAAAIGNPAASRAVGNANGKNPISIIVPCHRLIGSDGSLTGYGGGLWRKKWLLKHEGVQISELRQASPPKSP
jgi:methylated-DNA-[protein]-cysteine S-methyltransferase